MDTQQSVAELKTWLYEQGDFDRIASLNDCLEQAERQGIPVGDAYHNWLYAQVRELHMEDVKRLAQKRRPV